MYKKCNKPPNWELKSRNFLKNLFFGGLRFIPGFLYRTEDVREALVQWWISSQNPLMALDMVVQYGSTCMLIKLDDFTSCAFLGSHNKYLLPYSKYAFEDLLCIWGVSYWSHLKKSLSRATSWHSRLESQIDCCCHQRRNLVCLEVSWVIPTLGKHNKRPKARV